MTTQLDIDDSAKNPLLPFDSSELDRFGIRIRPAEFARLLACSKQAVSLWIREGKIRLDADGRLDPRKAVAQLLRNTDPGKLRVRVLQPLMRDIGTYQQRIAELENALASGKENADFYEAATGELLDLVDRIQDQLLEEWETLSELSPDLAMAAFCGWLEHVQKTDQDTTEDRIVDFLQADDTGAPDKRKKGKADIRPHLTNLKPEKE